MVNKMKCNLNWGKLLESYTPNDYITGSHNFGYTLILQESIDSHEALLSNKAFCVAYLSSEGAADGS